MRERPIIFNGPMVRAVLSNDKTQTRRTKGLEYVSRPENDPDGWCCARVADGHAYMVYKHSPHERAIRCPYGKPGDRLWVREAWSNDFANHYPHDVVWYAADNGRRHDIELRNGVRGIYSPKSGAFVPFRWKPSIHMPRSACRLILEIVRVRVERLQAVTEAEARAEGIHQQSTTGWFSVAGTGGAGTTACAAFALLWQSINGPGAWEANPWVWVVEFRRVR